jgi:hypothetical protein
MFLPSSNRFCFQGKCVVCDVFTMIFFIVSFLLVIEFLASIDFLLVFFYFVVVATWN